MSVNNFVFKYFYFSVVNLIINTKQAIKLQLKVYSKIKANYND